MNDVTPMVARPLAVLLFLACGWSSGCDLGIDDAASFEANWDGTPGMLGVVEFLNAPSTTFQLLDLGVGLERRAAEGLITHRNGADGWLGTDDDDLFDSIDEVHRVDFVGPATVARLVEYLDAYGTLAAAQGILGVYDGVEFTFEEAAKTLQVANDTPFSVLDDDAGLHAAAVQQIVGARPLDSVAELAALKGVGPKTLEKLKIWAMDVAPACEPSPHLDPSDTDVAASGRWTLCTEGANEACLSASQVSGPALLESYLAEPSGHGPCVHVVEPLCSFVEEATGHCCYVVEISEACKG